MLPMFYILDKVGDGNHSRHQYQLATRESPLSYRLNNSEFGLIWRKMMKNNLFYYSSLKQFSIDYKFN